VCLGSKWDLLKKILKTTFQDSYALDAEKLIAKFLNIPVKSVAINFSKGNLKGIWNFFDFENLEEVNFFLEKPHQIEEYFQKGGGYDTPLKYAPDPELLNLMSHEKLF
jgi:hypothetical protein